MQVSVEKTSELSRKMTITVPEDVVQDKVNERLKSVAREEVRLTGFVLRKVPQKVVHKMYGARISNEITGDLIQTNYFLALQWKNDLRPARYAIN